MQIPHYPGDKAGAEIFHRADCYLELGSLKAVMTGALLGHSFVQPSVVLDHIEFSATAQPNFGDKKLAQDFLGAFFGLWNQIAEHRNPNKPFSFSQPDASWKMDDIEAWIRFAELMEFEVGEFLIGLGLSETPTFLELEGFDEVDPTNYLPYLISRHLEDLEKENQTLKKSKSSDATPVSDIIQAIDRDLKKYHAPFLEVMASIEVVPHPVARSGQKMGEMSPAPAVVEKSSGNAAFSSSTTTVRLPENLDNADPKS